MNKIKIWVDEKKPPKGWIHTKDFPSFSNLLDTVKLEEIEAISFGTDLENEDDEDFCFDANDCAVNLIERAKGHELPKCFNHTKNPNLQKTINHYVKSYNHSEYCVQLQ